MTRWAQKGAAEELRKLRKLIEDEKGKLDPLTVEFTLWCLDNSDAFGGESSVMSSVAAMAGLDEDAIAHVMAKIHHTPLPNAGPGSPSQAIAFILLGMFLVDRRNQKRN